ENINGRGVAPKRRADLGSLNHGSRCHQHLARNGYAFFSGRFRGLCSSHAFKNCIGNRYTELVLHKLSISKAYQGPDARYDGNSAVLNAAQEIFQQIQIKHRLRYRILRSGFHFVGEATNFLIQLPTSRVGANSDDKPGSRADRISADVEPTIQVTDNVD